MAIYSKHPQIKKKTVSIKGERMNNTCIYSDMIINKDTIRVYNIHLASNWFKNTDYSFIQNPQKEKIKEGMIFTIEPMINLGNYETKVLNDGWTAVTKDKSLSAQFEHTVGITKDGYEIFTQSKNFS